MNCVSENLTHRAALWTCCAPQPTTDERVCIRDVKETSITRRLPVLKKDGAGQV